MSRKWITKRCPVCQAEFEVMQQNDKKYCGPACRAAAPNDQAKAKERAFTRDTPFLCWKWQTEGMSLEHIAELLNRSPQNVEKAIHQFLEGQVC